MESQKTKSMLYNKKGEVGGAVATMITLVAGVGVAVMILIFVGVLGGTAFDLTEPTLDSIGSHAVADESFLMLTNISSQLAHRDLVVGSVNITNSTFEAIGLGNFTIDYTQGQIMLVTGGIVNGGLSNNNTLGYINYTWGTDTVRESVKGGIVSSFSALETTGSYMPIAVLAVVIWIVLVMVLGFSMVGKLGGGNSAL